MSCHNNIPAVPLLLIHAHPPPVEFLTLTLGRKILLLPPVTLLEARQVNSNVEPAVFAMIHVGSRDVGTVVASLGHIAQLPLYMLQHDRDVPKDNLHLRVAAAAVDTNLYVGGLFENSTMVDNPTT